MARNFFPRSSVYLAIGFVALCVVAYVLLINQGTTIINQAISPNGKWEAVVMVKNGGAASGYVTELSIVDARAPFKSQRAIMSKGVLSLDDNDGAVHWGNKGQIDIHCKWLSDQNLRVEFPRSARIIRQNGTDGPITINYDSM